MRFRAVVVAVALLAVTCGDREAGLTAVEPVDRPDVPAALRFRGSTLSDGPIDLTALAGRPVVFWFWSSSCTECAKQAPTASVFAAMARGDASVVGVTCGSLEAARTFEERHELGFPTLHDADGTLTAALGIACQPAWSFVDAEGGVEVVRRALDLDELSEHLERAGGAAVR